MATKQATMDFLMDQLSAAGPVATRRMFGNYALYYDTKTVAFVCEDQLFVKPTLAGRTFLGTVVEACPYPGARLYFLIEDWDDPEALIQLIQITAQELPFPKEKAAKKPKPSSARAKRVVKEK